MQNGKPAGALFTWDDYLSIPDDDGLRHEVLGGEHVVSPAPEVDHQRVLGRLYRALGDVVEARGLGEVLMAPVDVKLSQIDIVQPDLIVVLQSSSQRLGRRFLDGPPDLAVEILSPYGGRRDRVRKKAIYAGKGIREYWIVDPERRVVEQFVLEGADYRLAGEHADRVVLVILQDAVIDLRSVFPDD